MYLLNLLHRAVDEFRLLVSERAFEYPFLQMLINTLLAWQLPLGIKFLDQLVQMI